MNQENQEQNDQTNYQVKVEKKHNYFYRITNQMNWKYYFGIHSTNKLDDGYLGTGKLIKEAISKYGKENFVKTIIQDYPTRKEASDHEKLAVTITQVEDEMCYNVKTGGDNETTYKHSEETKIKFRQNNLGKKLLDSTKKKISEALSGENNPNFGKTIPAHQKEILSKTHKGKVLSKETRQKMSESRSGEKNYGFGQTWSPELKKRMSEGHLRNMNDSTRKKISDAARKTACIIDGIFFESIKLASEYHNISRGLLCHRLKSDMNKYNTWNYFKLEDYI